MFRKTGVMLAAGAAVVLVGGAVAYASIPDASGVIHGCYKDGDLNKGSLYVIDSAGTCPSGYTALNWNQDAIFRTGATVETDIGPGEHRFTVLCPEGTAVISGGFSQGGDNVHVYSSRPQYNPEAWVVDVNNPISPSLVSVAAYAICTRVA